MSAIYELVIFLAILATIVESKGEHTHFLSFLYLFLIFFVTKLSIYSLAVTDFHLF